MLASGDYGDALPRLLGAVLFALGVVIMQILRHPLFLVLFAIVRLGVLVTGMSYLLDRRAGRT